MAAARYNADPLPSPNAYQFSNPSQGLRATFTSSGARIVSSPGARDRDLTIKLIGYGYGSRMTELDSQKFLRDGIESNTNILCQKDPQSPSPNPQSKSGSSTARRALSTDSRCLCRRRPNEAAMRRCA